MTESLSTRIVEELTVSEDLILIITHRPAPEENGYVLKSKGTGGVVPIDDGEIVDLILKLRTIEDIETRKAFAPESRPIPEFATEADAREWMEGEVGDPYIDNYRIAYEDDPKSKISYELAVHKGCCGFFDRDVVIGGRKATIGCNYGH